MLASKLDWVRSTPLGWPVLPEVYWISAGSSPSRLGTRRSSPEAEVVGRASVLAVTTDESDGTRPTSSVATRSTSAKVIITRALAFRRMPTCRSAYSSMRSARNGGYNGTGTHPAISVPKNAAKKSGSVRSMMATVSRRPRPRSSSPLATSVAARQSSPYVSDSSLPSS